MKTNDDAIQKLMAALGSAEDRLRQHFEGVYFSTEFALSLEDALREVGGESRMVASYSHFRHESAHLVTAVSAYKKMLDKLAPGQYQDQSPELKVTVEEMARRVAVVAFIDLGLHNPVHAIEATRSDWPGATFVLYYSAAEYDRACEPLHPEWRERFKHYYAIEKDAGIDLREAMRRLLPIVSNTARQRRDSIRALPSIFISYSSSDKAFVDRLAARLASDGYRIWIDHKRIDPSSEWMDVINRALETSEYLILVMSEQALASRFVKIEYRYFISAGKPLVPLRIEALTGLPPELTAIQYIDFTAMDFELGYSFIVKALN